MIEPRFPTTLARCHDEIRRLSEIIDDLRARADYEGDEVRWQEGRQLGLSPSEAAIYGTLLRYAGTVAPTSRLLHAMETHGDTTATEAVLKVHISRMRRKLGNVTILSRWQAGYALVENADSGRPEIDIQILRELEREPQGCATYVLAQRLRLETVVVSARLRAMQKQGEVGAAYGRTPGRKRLRVWHKAHNEVA